MKNWFYYKDTNRQLERHEVIYRNIRRPFFSFTHLNQRNINTVRAAGLDGTGLTLPEVVEVWEQDVSIVGWCEAHHVVLGHFAEGLAIQSLEQHDIYLFQHILLDGPVQPLSHMVLRPNLRVWRHTNTLVCFNFLTERGFQNATYRDEHLLQKTMALYTF